MAESTVAVGFVSVVLSAIKGKDRDINSLVKKVGTFLLGVPTQKNSIYFSKSPWSPEKFVYTKKYGKNKNLHYL